MYWGRLHQWLKPIWDKRDELRQKNLPLYFVVNALVGLACIVASKITSNILDEFSSDAQWGWILIGFWVLIYVVAAILLQRDYARAKSLPEGKVFTWRGWGTAVFFAAVFGIQCILVPLLHGNLRIFANNSQLQTYIVTQSGGSRNSLKDSHILTADRLTTIVLQPSRSIVLKFQPPHPDRTLAVMVNARFGLPHYSDIIPTGLWVPAVRDTTASPLTGKQYPDLTETRWIWPSNGLFSQTNAPYSSDVFSISSNVPSGSFMASFEVFSDLAGSQAQTYKVRFEINQ